MCVSCCLSSSAMMAINQWSPLMWLFTNFGFFSIVQKKGTTDLTVRARVRNDLDALRDRYLAALGPTTTKTGSDYPWRATVSHAALAEAMGKIVMDLHYSNYKDEVAAKQGKDRAHRYAKVWGALYDMPEEVPMAPKKVTGTTKDTGEAPWPITIPSSMKVAYGGVVIDDEGHVLLREPRGHYDGYVWTFAKGRPDKGESAETAALREVVEETAVKARILGPIPGEFPGGTTINRYFLMVPNAPLSPLPTDCAETVSVRWVEVEEARSLINQTTNPKGRQRDLAVLDAAMKAWKSLQG